MENNKSIEYGKLVEIKNKLYLLKNNIVYNISGDTSSLLHEAIPKNTNIKIQEQTNLTYKNKKPKYEFFCVLENNIIVAKCCVISV